MNFFDKFVSEHHVIKCGLGDHSDHLHITVSNNLEIGIPSNEIWYTSEDGEVITPYNEDVFGATILSNTYENGKGVVTFDGDVTSIGDSAFFDCSGLTSITIPNSVTSIGSKAFENCSGLPIEEGVRYAGTVLVEGTEKTRMTYTIKDGTRWIADHAFDNCSDLTSITIPNSVISIGTSAFELCSSLTSITIPNSVTNIGERAFYNCTGLTSITIPESVTSLGHYAFSNFWAEQVIIYITNSEQLDMIIATELGLGSEIYLHGELVYTEENPNSGS